MRTRSFPLSVLAIVAVLTALLIAPAPADAQLDRLRRVVSGELNRKIDQMLRDSVRCALGDSTCAQEAADKGEQVIYTDEGGEVIVDDDGVPITDRNEAASRAGVDITEAEPAPPRPGEGAWANYDFVPGDRVIFYEDFSDDRVGDFPRRLEFVRGNWEVVEWEGRTLLRNTGPRGSAFKVLLPSELPERFTIELEVYVSHANYRFVLLTTDPGGAGQWSTLGANMLTVGAASGTGVEHSDRDGPKSVNRTDQVGERLVPVRLMVDDRYAKAYVEEQRVSNVPNSNFPRSSVVYVENTYNATAETPIYLGAIRVAAGGLDLYDKLAEDGRVTTRGILFAVGSAVIRPESTPTLEEIGRMLQEHADLRIQIEGHTDSTGEDASNQALSEERAASVRQFLIDQYGIDGSRLVPQGFGETVPVDDNDTPEGRQNNRRVDLVRLDGTG